jgi:hypothetical protein
LVTTRKLKTLSLETSTTKLKALSFKRIERGKKGGGSPSLTIREFKTLSLKNSKKVQLSKL